MSFALPWMLLGLLGLPALTAIYWLRSRSRVRVVSSLLLWTDQRAPRQGGRIFQRLQTPLIFLLELLAITAIVLAAAGPGFVHSRFTRPIVVVLDNSYSMRAGGDDSPRRRAEDALAATLRQTDYAARFVLAGARPRLLGDPLRSGDRLTRITEQWTCIAPTAALDQAIALAAETGGPDSRILVLSDHAPSGNLPAGKVQWQAFGAAVGNVAFTAAARTTASDSAKGLEDRVLLEVTNLSRTAARTELTVQGADLTSPQVRVIELAAGAASRIVLQVPSGSPPLRAHLSQDQLAVDNAVVLVSPYRRLLRVQLLIADTAREPATSAKNQPDTGGLRIPLTRALEATGQVTFTSTHPDLIISDRPAARNEAWQFQLLRGPKLVSFDGPYVLDRGHPLTEGISLAAVIWSAAENAAPVGTPVVTAGNTVLLADQETAGGAHQLQMALEPDIATLTDSPDWPILIANLVRWRLAALPGCSDPNVRLGQPVHIVLSNETALLKEATLVPPEGADQTLPIRGKQLDVEPDRPGLWVFQAGETRIPFACNVLHSDESDLTQCAAGTWGDWNQSQVHQDHYVSLQWVLVLLAVGCLGAHMTLLRRVGGDAA